MSFHLPAYNPHVDMIPWDSGVWSSDNYNPNLIGRNKPGVLGPYHPIIHYMTKKEFEALGDKIDPDKVPVWE